MYVLAIDLGSGGPKVGVVDEAGRVVASAAERTTTLLLPAGGAEQDPHEWWQAVARAARRAIQTSGVDGGSIQAVSCTSQWSVIVPVGENAQPLMNAVHWLDMRGAPYNQAISGGFPAVEGYGLFKLLKWIRLAGMVPTHSGIDSLAHILYIKNARPEIYNETYKFLEPMDYLSLCLTGRFAASLCTVFPYILADIRDLENRAYDPWLLEIAGVDVDKLPELLPISGSVGQVRPVAADELGISREAQIFVPANDNQTAAIGSGAVKDYDSVIILGTSGYLAGHVPFKKTDVFQSLTTIPSPLPGKYLILAEMGNTGKVVETFLRQMVYPDDPFQTGEEPADEFDRFNRAAGTVGAGSGGTLFLPWFNGIIAPQADGFARGGFLNLSYQTTRAHMARAVLEGIAFSWRWMVEAVQGFTGRRFESLRLAGGGAQSDVWVQIMADVIGIPMQRIAQPRLVNVRGAAFLALNSLGHVSIQDSADRVEIDRVFEPNRTHKPLYDERYLQFRASYKNLRPVFRALNHARSTAG
jgi:xylulokinase